MLIYEILLIIKSGSPNETELELLEIKGLLQGVSEILMAFAS